MKQLTIEWSSLAREQVAEAQRWWQENCGDARLELDIERALKVITGFPDAGTTAEHIMLGLQQYPLRRTKHMIYYEVDRAERVVRILAFWSTARGSGPPL